MNTVYTIEDIRHQRLAKREEIHKSVAQMKTLCTDLFAPQRSTSKVEGIMQNVNAGIAAWDGIMTGLRLMRRVQSFFRKNKRK